MFSHYGYWLPAWQHRWESSQSKTPFETYQKCSRSACPEPTESAPVFLTRSPRLDVCSALQQAVIPSWLQTEFPGELVKVINWTLSQTLDQVSSFLCGGREPTFYGILPDHFLLTQRLFAMGVTQRVTSKSTVGMEDLSTDLHF